MRLVALAIVCLAPWSGARADLPANAAPTAVVDALHTALVEAGRTGDASSRDERLGKLQRAVNASHDFDFIARLVGGRFWIDLTDAERVQFTDLFRRASIATYADRFVSAEGVTFDRATMVGTRGERMTVRSNMNRPNGDAIVFDYVLHHHNDRWQIITIVVDGVSDLALQRAELTGLYADAGFAAVIDRLEARIRGS